MDTVLNSIVDVASTTSTMDISNTIGDVVGTALNNTIGRILYFIVSGINWFLSVIYQFFEVFSGQVKVSYNGEENYLTNIFFENSTIASIYWGMAIIGVVLCFAFTIIAVIRKMFDGSDKVQLSLGAILGSSCKSILIILALNVVMIGVLNFSNVLMQRVVYIFNAGSSLTEEQEITFTEDQFATMGRVLNTIGNYSLNPSYNSRYNLNSCFNEIRGDLLYLQQQGVFNFYYLTKDANGNEIETWQSALQGLVFAANLEKELKMDVYNEGVSNALLEIMDMLESNTEFYPLEHYKRSPVPLSNIPLDRVLFLACTYNAALNTEFNINPSHTDPLRGPYYNGQKSIYDFDQVSEDFNLLWGFNYIIFFVIVFGIYKEMFYILLDCVARIYNMVLLYLLAPPFIALSPLDGGGKTKQWMTAFVVQCFGVFGTVIAMRLLLTFAPIVISTQLQIFSNAIMDIVAKAILVYGGALTARKASGMFTGILADSAGYQSISAGSLRDEHDKFMASGGSSKGSYPSQMQQAANKAGNVNADGNNRVGTDGPMPQKVNQGGTTDGGPTGGGTPNGGTTTTGGPSSGGTTIGETKMDETTVGGTTDTGTTIGGPTGGGTTIGETKMDETTVGGTTDTGTTIGGGPIGGGTTDTGTVIGGGPTIINDFQPIPVAPEFVPNDVRYPQQEAPPKSPPPARNNDNQGKQDQ